MINKKKLNELPYFFKLSRKSNKIDSKSREIIPKEQRANGNEWNRSENEKRNAPQPRGNVLIQR